jgi:hypothetical protein
MTPAEASSALNAALLEGQGLLQLAIIGPENIGRLDAASDGHACILRVIEVVADTLAEYTSPDLASLSCLLCARQFWRDRPPQAMAVLTADTPSPRAALACGICASCQTAHPDRALQSATLAGLRERFGLSIRELSPFSAPGHA